MSVAEGLKRVLDIRNAIRGKMVALGLSQGNDNFDQVKTSVENIIDNTKKTDTATAIQGVFSSGQTGAVFSTGLQGYSSDASMVKVPVSNLASENIKEGVNIGGVVGQVKEYKSLRASGGNDDYCFPTSERVSIKNDGTAEIEVSYYTSGWRTTSFDIKLY